MENSGTSEDPNNKVTVQSAAHNGSGPPEQILDNDPEADAENPSSGPPSAPSNSFAITESQSGEKPNSMTAEFGGVGRPDSWNAAESDIVKDKRGMISGISTASHKHWAQQVEHDHKIYSSTEVTESDDSKQRNSQAHIYNVTPFTLFSRVVERTKSFHDALAFSVHESQYILPIEKQRNFPDEMFRMVNLGENEKKNGKKKPVYIRLVRVRHDLFDSRNVDEDYRADIDRTNDPVRKFNDEDNTIG